jgi:mannose-6-phosphate isomerase-like protein (cupin superfamily)
MAGFRGKGKPSMSSKATNAVVRKDEDRFGAPFPFLNGNFFCKISAVDTLGAVCVFDTVRTARGGPPLHFHHEQDEWFCVMDGEFHVRIGEVIHHLGEGDSVFGPRGIPHAFLNISETGRLMIMFSPAGTMEAFFSEGTKRAPMTAKEFADLSAEHGMTVVGPPLPHG